MKQKVAVSIDEQLLAQIDGMVQEERFESRSAAVEAALAQLIDAQAEERFERVLDQLTDEDRREMQALAEEGLGDWAELVRRNEW